MNPTFPQVKPFPSPQVKMIHSFVCSFTTSSIAWMCLSIWQVYRDDLEKFRQFW